MRSEHARRKDASPHSIGSKSTNTSPTDDRATVKMWNRPLPDDLIDRANSPAAANQENGEVSPGRRTNIEWPVWRPLLAILFLSLVIRVTDLDRKIASLSYDAARNEWPFERAEPWLSFYRYGTIPPIMLGIAGTIVALGSPWVMYSVSKAQVRAVQRGGLFLGLLLSIGPGLLVNVWLKTLWGRPRPIQCSDFGGELTFMPVGEWATVSFHNSSFPSGHASVAFFLMGLGFVIGPQYGRCQRLCFFGGICYGMAMGFTRVLQGGHFLTDVLWAGMIVYLVGVALAYLLLRPATSTAQDQPLVTANSLK